MGATRPADRESVDALGEVGDHIAAVHLAVDEDVEIEALLPADPIFGRLPLEVDELRISELAARVRVARFLQVIGLPERADGRRQQDPTAHAFTPPVARAAATSAFSFFTAMSCGRYSSPVVVESHSRSAGTFRSADSTSSTLSRSVSTRVLRASMMPITTICLNARSPSRAFVSRLRASIPTWATGNDASLSRILSAGKKYGYTASGTPAFARRSNAARASAMSSGRATRRGSPKSMSLGAG